jgi:DNA-binding response OmpR family regulator
VESPKRVLVVDDEPTIRELVADALREFGYQIETAANGAEALEVMQRWLPDAIVLDLMMPRLNERIGASAWLGKPFELDRLVELIGELTDAPAPFTKTPGDGQAVLFPSAFEA